MHNWDDIYDPSQPNSYEEYQNSDERLLEIREWKDRLYTHRIKNRSGSVDRSSSSASGGGGDGILEIQRTGTMLPYTPSPERKVHCWIESSFRPGLSFAPPTNFGATFSATESKNHAAESEDYARRPRLSNIVEVSTHANSANIAKSPPSLATGPHDHSNPSSSTKQPSNPSISRAPIRYNLPLPPPDIAEPEAESVDALSNENTEAAETHDDDPPRSLRPGQRGFAERLMSKYGWTKGSGLGAEGTGIVNPLRVQIAKQKKKPDSEGGGFVGPGGRGTIIGSKKPGSKPYSEGGKWGTMSEVVILRGMLRGLDLDAEMDRAADGGLMQEIGDECGEKVSNVCAQFAAKVDCNHGHLSSMGGWREFSSTAGTRPVPLFSSNSQASCRRSG